MELLYWHVFPIAGLWSGSQYPVARKIASVIDYNKDKKQVYHKKKSNYIRVNNTFFSFIRYERHGDLHARVL